MSEEVSIEDKERTHCAEHVLGAWRSWYAMVAEELPDEEERKYYNALRDLCCR